MLGYTIWTEASQRAGAFVHLGRGGGGEGEEEVEAQEEGACDIEERRRANMLANRQRLEALGVLDAAAALGADESAKPPKKSRERKSKQAEEDLDPANLRRSGRERGSVTYKEEDYLTELRHLGGGGGGGGPRTRREVDEEELQELRQKHGNAAPGDDEGVEDDEKPKKKGRGNIDSGKGVRLQGGRVYDSKFGTCCHWCRQKTLEEHVTCTNPNCGNGKRLATTFCKKCLLNRNGEDSVAAAASGKWQCPQCRGSCGPGCVACCNCGPCRKRANLEPTGQILRMAKDKGFYNVHDYLVHMVTGETPEQIAARKLKFRWGKWLAGEGAADQEEEEEGACEACQDGVPCDLHPAEEQEGQQQQEAGAQQPQEGRGRAGTSKAAAAPAAGKEEGAGASARGKGRKGKATSEPEADGQAQQKQQPQAAGGKRAPKRAAKVGGEDPTAKDEDKEGTLAGKGKRQRKAPAAVAPPAASKEPDGPGKEGEEENDAPAAPPTAAAGTQRHKLASKLQATGRPTVAPAPAGPASGEAAPAGATGVQAPAPLATAMGTTALLHGVTLTKRQSKQLELGLVSMEDLLAQIRGREQPSQPLAPVDGNRAA